MIMSRTIRNADKKLNSLLKKPMINLIYDLFFYNIYKAVEKYEVIKVY